MRKDVELRMKEISHNLHPDSWDTERILSEGGAVLIIITK
jgi:hypothetical protein